MAVCVNEYPDKSVVGREDLNRSKTTPGPAVITVSSRDTIVMRCVEVEALENLFG